MKAYVCLSLVFPGLMLLVNSDEKFPDASGWCCLLAQDLALSFPACVNIACDDPGPTPTSSTRATTEPPILVDPEAWGVMKDKKPLPINKVMMSTTTFEGDMLGIDVEDTMEVVATQPQANFVRDEEKRWPKHEVPYQLSSTFQPVHKRRIRDAMDFIQQKTCVRFRQKTAADNDYVYVMPGFGCSSYVGRQGGKQYSILQAAGCMESGLIQHELLHTLGLYHEQSRTDRDNYVDINWKNIPKDAQKQFQKYSDIEVTAFGVEYDFDSLMHYGQYDFAIDPNEYTIRPKSGSAEGVTIGQRYGISETDARKVSLAYCESKGGCLETGWTISGTKCFFFSFNSDAASRVTFVLARNQCRKMDSHIAVPAATSELKAIKDALKESGNKVWVGSCQSIDAGVESTMEYEASCDSNLHFVCEKNM